MKVAPVSTDLLIKLGLGVLVLGVVWYGLNKAANVGGQLATQVNDALNPTSNNNVAYQTANWATGGTSDQSIGTRLYDFFHPNQTF